MAVLKNLLKKNKRRLGITFLWVGLFCFVAGFTVLLRKDIPLLSPVTSATTFQFLQTNDVQSQSNKAVYGFLPYWNVNKIVLHPELTHLAYFSLQIGGDGKIITQSEDVDAVQGFFKWSSDTVLDLIQSQQKHEGRVDLVLTQFNNDDIVSLATQPGAQKNLLQSLDSLLLAYPIDGINIDIEYTGEVTQHLRTSFTNLLKNIHSHIKQKHPSVQISIDVYASAAKDTQIWEITKMHNYVDYIIVMAYDFHRRSSPVAGPVAPVFGGKKMWDDDITQNMRRFLTSVPKEKILLGMPFYGYGWRTTSRESLALTYPETGETFSVDRIQELLEKKEELELIEGWNEEALSPYLSYKKDDMTYVVYYENSRSLSYKMDLVNQLELGGIAIWALGYEGQGRELWDVIQRKMN